MRARWSPGSEVADDSTPVPEALARLTRALLAVGTKYVALTTLRPKPDDTVDGELTSHIVHLFRRGIDDGTLRKNLDPEALARIYGDLVDGAIVRATRNSTSVEKMSDAIVNVLLDGTRR